MYIPAYCSMAYLEDITNRSLIDYLDPDKDISGAKTFVDILQLVKDGLQIRTDVSAEKIEERSFNPYIKHLIKNLRIKPQQEAFLTLRKEEDRFFKEHVPTVEIYLLSEGNKSKTQDYQSKSGCHFLTCTDDHGLLFEECIDTFKRGTNKSWAFAKPYINPHHSIVFADPYIFKEASQKSLTKLFENIIPVGLKGAYHVTLIGSDQNRKNDLPSKKQIVDWVERFAVLLSRKIPQVTVEYHIYNKEEFHDRYIITNNTCIFSGYGIDIIRNENETQREGTWIAFKPFQRKTVNGQKGVLFYRTMIDKLRIFKSWIEQGSTPSSTNPLFRL